MAERVAQEAAARTLRDARSDLQRTMAEEAVLGALLTAGSETWLLIRDDFSRTLFPSPALHTIASILEARLRAGKIVDPVLLAEELDRLRVPESLVPRDLPWALGRAIGSAANVRHYLEELMRKKAERDGEVSPRRPPPPLLGDQLGAALERLERRQLGQERPVPLPDGWATLRQLLGGGLWPGAYMLVGNTGSGKTQFALQVGFEAARQAAPALYVGLELGKLGVASRFLAMAQRARDPRARTMWSYLYNGQLDRNAFGEVCAAAADLDTLPMHVEIGDAFAFDAARMTELIESMRGAYPEQRDAKGRALDGSRPFVVVLDFLQLVGGETATGRLLDLRERIAMASYAARRAASRLNAVVLIVSSTARENYAILDNDEARGSGKDGKGQARVPFGQGDPVRFIGLGKESGEIEYAADCSLVLGRLPGHSGPPPWNMACGVAKLRARSRDAAELDGWARMQFDGTFWGESAGDRPAETAQPSRAAGRSSGSGLFDGDDL